jgi:hypothetical protein
MAAALVSGPVLLGGGRTLTASCSGMARVQPASPGGPAALAGVIRAATAAAAGMARRRTGRVPSRKIRLVVIFVPADRIARAQLSARAGGCVRWATHLTALGRDILAYAPTMPALPSEPGQQPAVLRPRQPSPGAGPGRVCPGRPGRS